jgi:hypothetical protein
LTAVVNDIVGLLHSPKERRRLLSIPSILEISGLPSLSFPLYTHALTTRAMPSKRESVVLLQNDPHIEDGITTMASQMKSELAKGGRRLGNLMSIR